jgi:hypothetical protein
LPDMVGEWLWPERKAEDEDRDGRNDELAHP